VSATRNQQDGTGQGAGCNFSIERGSYPRQSIRRKTQGLRFRARQRGVSAGL
jgi:hypothetical protein